MVTSSSEQDNCSLLDYKLSLFGAPNIRERNVSFLSDYTSAEVNLELVVFAW